jgi:hypothetical protein
MDRKLFLARRNDKTKFRRITIPRTGREGDM